MGDFTIVLVQSSIYRHSTQTLLQEELQTAIHSSLPVLSLPANPPTHYGIFHAHQCLLPVLQPLLTASLSVSFRSYKSAECRSNRTPLLL
jgi:hypothetical protein